MSITKKIVILLRSVLLLSLMAYLVACGGMSEQEGIDKAREHYQSRDIRAAGIELKNVLMQNAQNAEARYLLGKISIEMSDAAGAEKDLRRALDAGWNEAEVNFLLSEVLFRQGKYASVLDDIPVKDSYPDDVKANMLGLWASAEQAMGKWKDSEGTIIAAETIAKDALWVLQSRIRLYLKDGDSESVEDTLDHAIAMYPSNQDLWLLKANMAITNKDLTAADEYFEKVISLEPLKIVSGWGRLARMGQSRVRLMQDDPGKSLEALNPALIQFSQDPELNYYRSLIAFKQQEYDVARDYLLKVFKVDPDHYAALLLSGNLYYIEKDYQQAASSLEKATAAKPENLSAQQLLGRIYMSLGQYNEAQNRLEFAASRTGENAELLTLLGVAKLKGGDEDSGLQNLEEAVKTSPANAGIRSELARAYMELGKTDKAIELLEAALKKGNESSSSMAALTVAFLRMGEYEKAIDMAKQLAVQVPDNPLPLHLEGLGHRAKGESGAARDCFHKALAIKPDFVLSILSQADMDILVGDTASARSRYEAVIKIQPNHVEAMTSLAYLLDREGKTDDAISLLEEARKSDKSAVDARLVLASYYLRKGKIKEAVIYAKEAEQLMPKLPKVLLVLSHAQLESGSLDAEKTINNLLNVAPELPEAHYYRALVRAKAYDASGTRKSLKKTLELDPGHVKARLALGNLEMQTGNLDTAMLLAKKLKNDHEELAAGYLLEGDVLMAKQDVAKAIEAYIEASQRAPDSGELIARLNRAYRMQGNSSAGYRVMEKWLEKNPDDNSMRFVLAVSHDADNHQDAAIIEYEKILKRQPDNAAALNDLAWLYNQKGKGEALEMARKANRLSPDNPAIQDTYGWLLVKSGWGESALALLEEAANKLPTNREVRYHLAVALKDTGRNDRAIQELTESLKGEEPFRGRDEAEKLLKQLNN